MKVWIVEVRYKYEAGYVIGVYTSEEKAKAGAVAFIQQHGFPHISECVFEQYDVN